MRRSLTAAAVVICACVITDAARADYYMSKSRAQAFAKHYVKGKYDTVGRVATVCRPQGRSAPEAGYIYHRWTCGWADAECGGVVLIVGSRGKGYYYGRVVRGITCE